MKKRPFVITIGSGKGGVGKSFISCNLSLILSQRYKTLIWDADIYFPNQHLLFGVEPAFRFNDFYTSKQNFEKYLYKVNDNLLLAAGTPAAGALDYNGELVIIDAFESIIKKDLFDFIVIDTASGLSMETLQSCIIADIAALVVTDEPTSLIDAYGLIKIFKSDYNFGKLGLIINNIIDNDDVKEIMKKFNAATIKFLKMEIETLGHILYDRYIRTSIVNQIPYVKSFPKNSTAMSLLELTNKIAEKNF